MSSLREKIIEKTVTIANVSDSAVVLFNKIRDAKTREEAESLREEWFDFLTKKKQVVSIDVVLGLLDTVKEEIILKQAKASDKVDASWSKVKALNFHAGYAQALNWVLVHFLGDKKS
jgi:Icc-related predicted phosphoesterase